MDRSNEPAVEGRRQPELTYWIDERDGAFPLPWWKVLPLFLVIGGAVIAIMTLIMIPVYERKVIDNAKDELRLAGIDPDAFAFDATYRDLDVRGILPERVTTAQIEAAIGKSDGLRDVDLDFQASTPPIAEEETIADEPVVVETASTTVTAVVTADGVVLSGEVPSASQRDSLVRSAAVRFGAANVTDELVVRDLEPTTPGAQGRAWRLAVLLGSLPEGAVGTASISDTQLSVDVTVSSERDADSLNTTVSQANRTFDRFSDVRITVETTPEVEVVELQEAFEGLSVEIRENVTFATGSDVLNDTAAATLDKVVDVMNLYPLPVVEVSGHTDNQGDDGVNLQLSEDRAAAVRQYLVDAGIDEARIESVGRGETEPLESNDTAEGRASNRRVELLALQTFGE